MATGLVFLMSILVLVFLLGGGVLFVVGLSNRHTRGATVGVASVLAVLVVSAVSFVWFLQVREVDTQRARAEREMARAERAMSEIAMDLPYDEVSEGTIEGHSFDSFAEEATDLRGAPDMTVEVSSGPAIGPYVLVLPTVLACLVVLFFIFKYAGPAAGFAVVGVGGLLFFVLAAWTMNGVRYEPVENQVYTASNSIIQDVPRTVDIAVPEASTAEATDTSSDEAVAEGISEEKTAKPSWASQPPKNVENVRRVAVESGWYDSPSTCNNRVDEEITKAVHNFLVEEVISQTGREKYVPPLDSLGITNRYIGDNIVTERHYESRDFEHQDGMSNLHVLLEFDEATRQDLLSRWRNRARQDNVMIVSFGMGSVLLSLAGVLGLIKLDTYTKGYYTKRLFIGVPAAIIGLLFTLAITAEWWDSLF